MKKNEQDPEILISVLDEKKQAKFEQPRYAKPIKGVDLTKRTESL